jgi:hypothetical protein
LARDQSSHPAVQQRLRAPCGRGGLREKDTSLEPDLSSTHAPLLANLAEDRPNRRQTTKHQKLDCASSALSVAIKQPKGNYPEVLILYLEACAALGAEIDPPSVLWRKQLPTRNAPSVSDRPTCSTRRFLNTTRFVLLPYFVAPALDVVAPIRAA